MQVWIIELENSDGCLRTLWGIYISEAAGLKGVQEYIDMNTISNDGISVSFNKIKEYCGLEHKWRELHKYYRVPDENGWEIRAQDFICLRPVEVVDENSSNGS